MLILYNRKTTILCRITLPYFSKRFYPGGLENILNVPKSSINRILKLIYKTNTIPLNTILECHNYLNEYKRFSKNVPNFYKELNLDLRNKNLYIPKNILFNTNNNLVKESLANAIQQTKTFQKYHTPTINSLEDIQISGLLSLSKEMRDVITNPDTPEKLAVSEYFNIILLKALYMFRDKNLTEKVFLSRVSTYIKNPDIPVPSLISKYFNVMAIQQWALVTVCGHAKYSKILLTAFSNNLINYDYYPSTVPILLFIEQNIYLTVMGTILKQNPNVIVTAINPDSTENLPGYSEELALKICHQKHPEYLLQKANIICTFQDVKTKTEISFLKSRVALFYNIDNINMKTALQLINNYTSYLDNIILKINENKNQYKKLAKILKDFKIELKQGGQCGRILKAFMDVIAQTIINPSYEHLNASIFADPGIDIHFKQFYIEILQKKFEDNLHKVIENSCYFPINNKLNYLEINDQLHKLIQQYFPESIAKNVWDNFMGFGAGQVMPMLLDNNDSVSS